MGGADPNVLKECRKVVKRFGAGLTVSEMIASQAMIRETRQSLLKQGVTPSFVIAFRGPATKLVQKDMEKVKAEDREVAAKIGMPEFEHLRAAVATGT